METAHRVAFSWLVLLSVWTAMGQEVRTLHRHTHTHTDTRTQTHTHTHTDTHTHTHTHALVCSPGKQWSEACLEIYTGVLKV